MYHPSRRTDQLASAAAKDCGYRGTTHRTRVATANSARVCAVVWVGVADFEGKGPAQATVCAPDAIERVEAAEYYRGPGRRGSLDGVWSGFAGQGTRRLHVGVEHQRLRVGLTPIEVLIAIDPANLQDAPHITAGGRAARRM